MVILYRKYEDKEYREYTDSYSSYFEDAMADKLKDLLGADYYNDVYVPFKNKIASKVKVGEDEEGKPIMGENPDLKLKKPDYLLKTYSKNPQALKDLIANYKTKRATTTQKKVEGAKKIGENDEYICYRITKYPAAQYYGSNTTWCITGRYKGIEEEGEKYFNNYIRDEKLDGGYYFFIHKSNPRRKYALLQKKDKTINSIWSALNSPLTMDKVPIFPLVKEIPELKDIYEDVDVGNQDHIKDRDKKSLEHDILVSCKLPKENSEDAIRNLKEILDGEEYKDYKFDLNNIKDNKSNTPLDWACYNDNTEVAKLLIEHEADVNSEDKYGNTPLSYACKSNKTELVKLLLEHGADVNIKDAFRYTPLDWACYNNNTELVKLLLEHGADINIKNEDGETPLIWACRNNKTEVAKFLIEHGDDANIKNQYGETPLIWVCKNNNTEVAKLLLEHDADVNIKDKDGDTPLYWACFGDNIELVKLLLEHGADVNSKDVDEFTPLIQACYNDNTELVKLLLEHGADVNIKDFDVNNLPRYITRNKEIEDLVLSYLNKNKRAESTRLRRLYRR